MKIVIINGSARKGNTLTAINAFIKLKSLNLTNSTLHHARDVVSVNALRDASIRMIQILQLIKLLPQI
jgi:multimeric flavodoxin WrbA